METKPQYPGWNLDLRWYPSKEEREMAYARGLWYTCRGSHSDVLLVRELAMMRFMDHVTDDRFWHTNIFDETVVDSWRREALAIPDETLWDILAAKNCDKYSESPSRLVSFLNENSIDFCILELQEKAKHFIQTGIVPTLDATFGIAKSDVVVDSNLQQSLQQVVAQLKSDQVSNPNWCPNTDQTAQNLVDPSMYPLAYGHSPFLPDEVVGVDDAIDKWSGKGEVIAKRPEWNLPPNEYDPTYNPDPRDARSDPGTSIPVSLWSTNYQWLPSNVRFSDDGTVEFTSYINNLHPTKYRRAYSAIEKLVDKSVPLWDQCLALCKPRRVTLTDRRTKEKVYDDKIGAGRHSPRMGFEMKLYSTDRQGGSDDGYPPTAATKRFRFVDPEEEKERRLSRNVERREERARKEAMAECDDDDSDYSWDLSTESSSADEGGSYREWWEEYEASTSPDPPPFDANEVTYAIDPTKALCEQFKNSGLQVIVHVSSIELTPDKPEFPCSEPQVEGMMNEHIVATALYCVNSENVTDPTLQFTALTDPNPDWDPDSASYSYCQEMLGLVLKLYGGSFCIQNYGEVIVRDGRLVAFPNVFEHEMSSFKLIDPTKPGRRSFIRLQLVDPLTRIISTANVPPQQAEWRDEAIEDMLKNGTTPNNDKTADSLPTTSRSTMPAEIATLLLEQTGESKTTKETLPIDMLRFGVVKLPVEIMDMVREESGGGLLTPLMPRAEAEEQRLNLIRERSTLRAETEDIAWVSYRFIGYWE